MNYGKYLYQKNKFRVKIDAHDYNFKKNHVERFLMEGNKVKTTIMFRGRERAHGNLGVKILDRVALDLGEIATIESRSRMEGNQMYQILTPKKAVLEKMKAAKEASAQNEERASTA